MKLQASDPTVMLGMTEDEGSVQEMLAVKKPHHYFLTWQ